MRIEEVGKGSAGVGKGLARGRHSRNQGFAKQPELSGYSDIRPFEAKSFCFCIGECIRQDYMAAIVMMIIVMSPFQRRPS